MKPIIITFFLLFVTLTSCKDFLELQPEFQINDETFYKNANDFEKALLGVYGVFRGFYGSSLLYPAELTTDNTEIQITNPTIAEVEFDEMNVTPTNTALQGMWETGLKTVYRCNVILNRIDAIDIDEAVKNRIIGETRFLRAFSYFYLVQLFGNVPLTDQEFRSPSQIAETDLSLKSKEEVYKVIISDLLSAESHLSPTLNADKSRVSLQTVKTLLGKVYLTEHNYELAAAKLKEVIDSKQYSLVTDYKSLFSKGNNNLAESIFEIKYVSGVNLGNIYSILFLPVINTTLFPNNLGGGGRMVPTLDMLNTYTAGDARKAASLNDSLPIVGGKKVYSRYGLKFVDFAATNLSDGSITYTVLRYADVLLMYAEALNEAGKTAETLPYINEVRKRAKLIELVEKNQAAVRLAIEKDRRNEFLFEGQRWFDLIRTGRAKEVLNAHFAAKKLTFTVQDYELLMPIPQREIDINPALKQNPGY